MDRFHVEDLPTKVLTAIGTIKSSQMLSSAGVKDVILISGTNGKCVLKRSHSTGFSKLQNESDTLQLIQKIGVPFAPVCILPIAKLHDQQYLLESYIPGDSLKKTLSPFRDHSMPDVVVQIASILKCIHNSALQNVNPEELLEKHLAKAKSNYHAGRIDLDEFEQLSPEETLNWLQVNKPTSYRIVLCHGDYRPKNIIWNGQKVIGIIDWEHSLYCSPYYDVSVLYYYLTKHERELFEVSYGLTPIDLFELTYFDNLSKYLNV